MGNQTRVDPVAVRRVGDTFGDTARSVDVAGTALGDCDFGAHLGQRYRHHETAYAAGLLAVARSVGKFAASARQFGDSLVRAADTLDDHDVGNADSIGDVEAGRG